MPRTAVASVFGKPKTEEPGRLRHRFEKYREYTDAEKKAMPKAPGGGYYKGEYAYAWVDAHFDNAKLVRLEVRVGGETDW